MHNGIRVVRGGYYGDWTAEIIQRLKGVHEPQEEKAVAAILKRLAEQPNSQSPLVSVEVGSFWAYYTLWFLEMFNDGRAVCLEPDPGFMQVGITNFALNDRSGTFLAGAIGAQPGAEIDFEAESDGIVRPTKLYTLKSLMDETNLTKVDVLFVDIQGAEIALLESAQEVLRSGAVRFIVVSTHHLSATGSAMTHRRAEQLLLAAGAHIVCEHSVSESFSADGLIVASFFDGDRDLTVDISYARAIESCDGEWEAHLERIRNEERRRADEATAALALVKAQLESEIETVRAIKDSTSWRVTKPLRELSSVLRRRGN